MDKNQENTDPVLRALQAKPQDAPGPDCPPESIWAEMVAGLLEQPVSEQLASHAARCNWCGPLLREATEDLAEDLTEEEETMLAQRKTANAAGQRELAGWLAARSGGRKVADKLGFVWWPRLAWVGATLAVLVGIASIIRSQRERDPNELLAQAYTAQRTMELRIPGAAYSQRHEIRGAGGSRVERPLAMVEAEKWLIINRPTRADDPIWLRAEGRLELLQGERDAVLTLERAHQLTPRDNAVEIDLASALLQRANQPQYEDDVNRATDLLREVTVRDPQNTVAWFNLAIASERSNLLREALQACDAYLKIDPSSGWAPEVLERKQRLQKAIEDHDRRSNLPVDGPETVWANYQRNASVEIELLEQRPEVYLFEAVSLWMPQIVGHIQSSGEQSAIKGAVDLVAQVALEQHADMWLSDLAVQFYKGSGPGAGMTSLVNAVTSNGSEHYREARASAHESARYFDRMGAPAGALWARFEAIYASRFLQDSDSCFHEAQSLLRQMQGKSYAWLEIQTRLEAATCASILGRMPEAREGAKLATEVARKHNYGTLYLRGISLLASLEWTTGNFAEATRLVNSGLERFWAGAFPPMRGYSLLSVLDSIAEDSEYWFGEVSIGREALQMVPNDLHHLMLALECQRVSDAARESGESLVAEQFLQESKNHFALGSQENDSIYHAVAALGRARSEAAKGDVAAAAARLRDAEHWANVSDNRFFQFDFFFLQAQVLRENRQFHAAGEASMRAVRIAENGLASIHGERERLVWTRKYDRAYRVWISLSLARNFREAFEAWEWYKAAPLRSLQQGSKSATTQTFSPVSWLDVSGQRKNDGTSGQYSEDSALLSYIVLPEQAGVWYRDSTRTEYARLSVSPEDIKEMVLKFANHCADRSTDERGIVLEQRRLYDILIGPVAERIRLRKTLIIEADDVLDALPFEILTDPRGKLLGEEHQISLSPGMAYLEGTRQVLVFSEQHRMLIVGSPSPGSVAGFRDETLVDAEREVREVHRMMPDSQVLMGAEATLAAILEKIEETEIFSFSGHTRLSKDGSGLLLGSLNLAGEAEVLDARQMESAGTKSVRLAVLLGCGTAGDGKQTLRQSGSLARVFIAAGVPQVVASRWPVDSEATKLLMESFYQGLKNGKSVHQALQMAKWDVRSKQEYSHPYYWAAFSVFGKAGAM